MTSMPKKKLGEYSIYKRSSRQDHHKYHSSYLKLYYRVKLYYLLKRMLPGTKIGR